MRTFQTDLIPALAHSDHQLHEVLINLPPENYQYALIKQVLVAAWLHLEKQQWVADVVSGVLGADMRALGALGAFAHPSNIPQEGGVPGFDGWSYFFHGKGCCLTHRDGESVDVDFDDGRCDIIDPYFFAAYLHSLKSPTCLQSRLIQPSPMSECWMAVLPELIRMEWIEGEHGFCLTNTGKGVARDSVVLWQAMDETDNPFAGAHAALLAGDPSLARVFLKDQPGCESHALIGELAARYESRCFDELMASAEDADSHGLRFILQAAAALGESYGHKVATYALKRRSFDAAMVFAVELTRYLGPAPYEQTLLRLLDKAWRARIPQPAIRAAAVASLLSMYTARTLPKKSRKILQRALGKRMGCMGDEACKLMYMIDSQAGLALLRKSLNASIPVVQDNAAAILAALATPESMELLSNHGSITAATMVAIVDGVELAKVVPFGTVLKIGERTVRCYNFAEIKAANREEWLRYCYRQVKADYLPRLRKWRRQSLL